MLALPLIDALHQWTLLLAWLSSPSPPPSRSMPTMAGSLALQHGHAGMQAYCAQRAHTHAHGHMLANTQNTRVHPHKLGAHLLWSLQTGRQQTPSLLGYQLPSRLGPEAPRACSRSSCGRQVRAKGSNAEELPHG